MSRSATAPGLQRPRRWDSPFAEDVSEADIARLLRLAPFRDMNPESFPRSAPLADILRNDGRLRTCQDGEIIVRQVLRSGSDATSTSTSPTSEIENHPARVSVQTRPGTKSK